MSTSPRQKLTLLVMSPKGTFVGDTIALVLAAQRFDPRIVGFVFNGIVIASDGDDTSESLMEKYRRKSYLVESSSSGTEEGDGEGNRKRRGDGER